MTILEVLNKQNTKRIYLEYLGELFWQSDLTTYQLLNKFVDMEANEALIQSINTKDFYWKLLTQIEKFYELEFVNIAKKVLTKMDDEKLEALVLGQNTKFHIQKYFNDWKYQCFIKHIYEKVNY